MADSGKLRDEDYRRLLEFRAGIRRFLSWSKSQAEKEGLTPTQHQLLLSIRGYRGDRGPTVGDVADSLLLQHHSAVELVDRAEDAKLVRRISDSEDRRRVRLRLTVLGERKLEAVAIPTLQELDKMGPQLRGIWDRLGEPRRE